MSSMASGVSRGFSRRKDTAASLRAPAQSAGVNAGRKPALRRMTQSSRSRTGTSRSTVSTSVNAPRCRSILTSRISTSFPDRRIASGVGSSRSLAVWTRSWTASTASTTEALHLNRTRIIRALVRTPVAWGSSATGAVVHFAKALDMARPGRRTAGLVGSGTGSGGRVGVGSSSKLSSGCSLSSSTSASGSGFASASALLRSWHRR